MGVLDTFAPRQGTQHVQQPTHRLGRVLRTVTTSADHLYVTLDRAANGISTFGPCRWMPRVVENGTVVLPAAGDRVEVALDELGTPVVVSWDVSAASTVIPLVSGSTPILQVVTTNTNTTITATDSVVLVTGGVTITLPASPPLGEQHEIKDAAGTAAASPITVAGNGRLIDGASTALISTNYEAIRVVAGSSAWHRL